MFSSEILFLKHLEYLRTEFFNNFFEGITILGEETIYIILICIIYFIFDKKLAQKLFFIAATSIGINCIIKNTVKLPRPFSDGKVTCVRPETATGYSFPSGHTQNTATCSSAFAIIFKKCSLIIFAVITTLLVGFSRLYLGAHYPSDVICGIILGVGLSYFFNHLYDKTENKNILYLITGIIITVFAVIYMFNPDPNFIDFYKFYGLFLGFIFAVNFEEKFVSFDYSCSIIKKIFRVIIGVTLSFVLKEAIKLLFSTSSIRLLFALNSLRYFILVAVVFGILPMVFKKLNM